MADKMMRVSGRGYDGTAKALKVNDEGSLILAGNRVEEVLTQDDVSVSSPNEVNNLKLWLDASQLNLSHSEPIELWEDLSGNGYHATQTNAGNRPTYSTGASHGLPSVRFDPTGLPKFFQSTNDDLFNNNSGLDVFVVAGYGLATYPSFMINQYDGTTDNRQWFLGSLSSGGVVNIGFSAQEKISEYSEDLFAGIDNYIYSPVPVGWNVFNGSWMPSDKSKLFINNLLSGEASEATESIETANQPLMIGGMTFSSGVKGNNGSISEIIAFDRKLSTEERNAIYDYLTDKWGLSGGRTIRFSKPIKSIEIYHDEVEPQTFTVNGIEMKVARGGWRSPVGGTPSDSVTIPSGIDCIVGRLE